MRIFVGSKRNKTARPEQRYSERPWPPWAESPTLGLAGAPDPPCQFIGQLNLAEIQNSSYSAKQLPQSGLLSFFSHNEWEETGSSSLCVRYFANTKKLERVAHAATDSDNRRLKPRGVVLTDGLTLPDPTGPWGDELGVATADFALWEAHNEVLAASSGTRLGLLCHLRATTGSDPTPSQEWLRLLCIPVDFEHIVMQHVAIREEDLASGNLEAGKLVWVDFDG